MQADQPDLPPGCQRRLLSEEFITSPILAATLPYLLPHYRTGYLTLKNEDGRSEVLVPPFLAALPCRLPLGTRSFQEISGRKNLKNKGRREDFLNYRTLPYP